MLAPNEPDDDDRYWYMKWSVFSGNIMRLDFRTVNEDLGINVCVPFAGNLFFSLFFSGQKN